MDPRLAIDGGPPAKTTPNFPMYPGGGEIGADEKKEVLEALERGYIFRYYGPREFPSKVAALEAALCDRMGSTYALATNSCTSSLISALVACGVGPGDEVIVPAYTYWSSASAVLMARAVPILAEVDDSLTMDPRGIEGLINRRTRAIMPVHMRGAPCDMDPVMSAARRHGLAVIEDNAQACGGSYRGETLGTFGDCGCFSLQYYKIITSGEGGALVTDDEGLYLKAQSCHDSAACWRPDRFAPARFPGELFAGYDFRMCEVTGAMGLAQMRRLDGLLERMRSRKARILSGIRDVEGLRLRRLNDPDGDTGICVIFFVPERDVTRRFVEALRAEGVAASVLYDPEVGDWHVYAHWGHLMDRVTPTREGCPFTCPYRGAPPPEYSRDMCPRSLDWLGRAVHIDVPPGMTDDDCDMIADAVRKVAGAYL